MKKTRILILTLTIIVIASINVNVVNSATNLNKYQVNVTKAESYLVNVVYNEDIGLMKESPYLMQNRYGLQSDNYLASIALENNYQEISDKLKASLVEWNYLNDSKYEALIGTKAPTLPFVVQDFFPIHNNTLESDNFNRPTIGGNWSATGGNWAIVDDWLNGSGGKEILYNTFATLANGDLTVKMKMTSGSYFGMGLRYENNTNFVVLWLNTIGGGQLVLQKVVNGVYTTVDWVAYPIQLGQVYTVRLELLEGIHRAWVDDMLETDAPVLQGNTTITHNTGYAFVMIDERTVAVYDDFTLVDYRIFNAFETEATQDNYEEYADLCIVASAIQNNNHNITESKRLFEIGLSYWDDFGFNDTHQVVPAYMTYQLALALIVANKIGYDLGGLGSTMEAIMWGLQNEDGGLATHYLKTLKPYGIGESNTETTSLAILAYRQTSNSVPLFPFNVNFDISLVLYIVVGIIFGSIIVNMIRKR